MYPGMDLVSRLPLVRVLLVVIPVLTAGRLLATALWSQPVGMGLLGEEWPYRTFYALATVGAIVWAGVSHTRLMTSAYLGTTLALLCIYQGVNLLSLHGVYGDAIFISLVFWISFAVIAIVGTMLSIQYILVHDRGARRKVGVEI